MKTGDLVLIPFPFAELTNRKVRPAVVVCETKDQFKDLVLCAVSSVVHTPLSENELLLSPAPVNGLRKTLMMLSGNPPSDSAIATARELVEG